MVLGGGGSERTISGSIHSDVDSLSSAFEGVALTGSAEDGANPGRNLPLRSTPGRKAKAQSKIFGQGGDGSRAPFKNLNVPKLIAKTEPALMSDVAISPHAMAHKALLSGTTAQVGGCSPFLPHPHLLHDSHNQYPLFIMPINVHILLEKFTAKRSPHV